MRIAVLEEFISGYADPGWCVDLVVFKEDGVLKVLVDTTNDGDLGKVPRMAGLLSLMLRLFRCPAMGHLQSKGLDELFCQNLQRRKHCVPGDYIRLSWNPRCQHSRRV